MNVSPPVESSRTVLYEKNHSCAVEKSLRGCIDSIVEVIEEHVRGDRMNHTIEHEYAERLPSFVCAVLMQNVNEVAAWYLLEHERAIDARAETAPRAAAGRARSAHRRCAACP